MRNKGFTLIELLAVIVILAIIALIATPIILGIISNTRNEARVRSAEAVSHALETGYLTTYMKCAAEGSSLNTCITTDKVIANTKIENERSRTTGSITTKDGVVCTLASNYALTCTYGGENVIEPVSVNGQPIMVCEKQGTESKIPSAAYTCHLDIDRTFYVLGDNATDSTKIDLIMDRNYVDNNVPVTVKWCASGTNNSCSSNITRYIPYIQEAFGTDVVVSLPTYERLFSLYESMSSISWFQGNLDNSESTTTIPYGYWTTSTIPSITNSARNIYFGGFGTNSVDKENLYGVRPVITIPKSLLD